MAALAVQVNNNNSQPRNNFQARPQASGLGRGGGGNRSGQYQPQRPLDSPPIAGYTGCFACGDTGHYKSECAVRRPGPRHGNRWSRPSTEQGASQSSQ